MVGVRREKSMERAMAGEETIEMVVEVGSGIGSDGVVNGVCEIALAHWVGLTPEKRVFRSRISP